MPPQERRSRRVRNGGGGPSRQPWSRGGDGACVLLPHSCLPPGLLMTWWFQPEPVYTGISLFAIVTWESCFSTSSLCGPLDPSCQGRRLGTHPHSPIAPVITLCPEGLGEGCDEPICNMPPLPAILRARCPGANTLLSKIQNGRVDSGEPTVRVGLRPRELSAGRSVCAWRQLVSVDPIPH